MLLIRYLLVFSCCWFLCIGIGKAQQQDSLEVDSIGLKNFLVLPIGYYTPETRLAGGISFAGLFRKVGAPLRQRPNSISLIATYTQNKQIIFYLPYSLSVKEGAYLINGEFSYYRYPYFFNGIGANKSGVEEESYSARFPRFRFTGLKRFYPNLYFGVQYWFQDTKVLEFEEGGLLASGSIPGSSGSTLSSMGPVFLLDKRDNFFAPTKGLYLKLSLLANASWLGSNYSFENYFLDFRHYRDLGKGHVIAWQGVARVMNGNVPFNRMAMLGGDQHMRGYRQGFYRDKKMMTTQLEYRSPMVWRIGLAAFGGVGSVGEDFEDFSLEHFLPSYGGGIRLALLPKQHINLRCDIGFGEEGSAFYLRLNEAF